jgi:hypothetical protein
LGVDSKQDERHVHRTARMGAQVVTSGTWCYYSSDQVPTGWPVSSEMVVSRE